MRAPPFATALADADADAFVHVGPPDDPVVSYLAGTQLPCRAAVVYGGRVAVVPERSLPAASGVPAEVTVLDPHSVPARRLPGLASDAVLAPRMLPHDAALSLEEAGIDVSSTVVHKHARRSKTPAEQKTLREAVAAAEAGLGAAGGLLADGVADDLGTPEAVRRAANAGIADDGAVPATTVRPASAEPDTPLRVTATAVVDGYHAPVRRTFVAGADGGWDRRATLGCEYGVDAAIDVIEAGETTAERAGEEATAELASLGFPPEDTTVDVHGVGLERREAPTGEATLAEGAVVSVSAAVTDDGRTVGVSDVAVIGADGAERVGSFPRSVVPKADY
ncbi:M24 family metallopeptidase [Halobacterium salinarum]|uniref:M24 family metallopeptidase n=1 Tax=Halobacterium salinarum TaxID=2242 RepID=UPI002555C630|nr:M24 family metallopeptidase [Halobacterium salinarum]MDL0119269.1 M24 family metallopeptidase [Halobacterium salinarum]